MELQADVFDIWAFRKTDQGTRYLLLHTSQQKADRYFNGGRFWQIPSGRLEGSEKVVEAVARVVGRFGLTPSGIWAAEHAYTIYNRRFEAMQIIGVFAAEVGADPSQLDPAEHAEYRWCSYEEAQSLVTYRGLKDGLRSTREYITGVASAPLELRLK